MVCHLITVQGELYERQAKHAQRVTAEQAEHALDNFASDETKVVRHRMTTAHGGEL